MKEKRFTLVEMIIVITIVMILAALLFPAIAALRNRSLKDRTKSYLMQLDAAIRSYSNDYGHYPYVCSGVNFSNTVSTSVASGNWSAYAVPNGKSLYNNIHGYLAKGDLATTDIGGGDLYTDAWAMPVIYLYLQQSGGRPSGSPIAKEGFENEFELWSAGPDKAFKNLRNGSTTINGTAKGDADNVTVTDAGVN